MATSPGRRLLRGVAPSRVLSGVLRGIVGRGRPEDPIPDVWTLLEWFEALGLSEQPFGVETFQRRLADAAGLEVVFLDARTILRGRAGNAEAAYQILRSEYVGAGISGGMIRDPLTEDAVILTPGGPRLEEAPTKPLYHELMHVALGDPVPVASRAPFPEGARHKVRMLTDRDGAEAPYWIPESRPFPAALAVDYAWCERRAEVLAGYAELAGEFGGELLRSMDDYFWA